LPSNIISHPTHNKLARNKKAEGENTQNGRKMPGRKKKAHNKVAIEMSGLKG
jgi:hypothetical protein